MNNGKTMSIVKYILAAEAPITLDVVMLTLLQEYLVQDESQARDDLIAENERLRGWLQQRDDTIIGLADRLATLGPANPYEVEHE